MLIKLAYIFEKLAPVVLKQDFLCINGANLGINGANLGINGANLGINGATLT